MASARRSIETIAATENDEVLRREGIEVLHGWAEFCSPDIIDVDGRRLTARRFVLATGARPAVPPIEGLDQLEVLTNENVFALDELPTSLAVLGGGAIGCELAQAFRRLGAQVTVVEALERLLPREEPEASTAITEAFQAEGITVRAGHEVTKIEVPEALARPVAVRLHLAHGEPVTVERVLVAVGRRAATDGLGLDAAGIETDDRGFIRTTPAQRTTARRIYAVGDIAGTVQFTHAAYEMGRIATANALSRRPPRRFDTSAIPSVTYTAPEVARVGITEADAAEHGGRVAFVPMSEVDRAVVAGETRGFVKLVTGPRPMLRRVGGGRFVGATVVAPRAGEMIHEIVLAMRTRMFPARVALTTHAYPTWSIAMQQAAAQFFIEVNGRRARPARRVQEP
jgi:pyruvate/2-oxoglutarate dehydrogenase complex dihydrolipoamide dehydrogenase (E3) component